MSKYTTQLRWIVEQEQGKIPASSSIRYTQATYKKIGLNEYPIFDEAYRKVLNDKIIDHFFFREIGFETCAQFAWYMRRTLNEIMPYYNKLYEVQSMIDDPMNDSDHSWKESWDENRDNTGGNVNIGEAHDRNVYQDTPMSLLDNSTSPTVEGMDYATSVTYNDGTTRDELKRDEQMHDYGWRVHDEKGRKVAQVEMFDKFKKKYMNIDLEIINELETLFMGLW